MKIEEIKLEGFRNFMSTLINLENHSLIIGANDIGKSNLLHAIRIMLDKTLSDSAIEPVESDFHVSQDGKQENSLSIQIKLVDIKEDAVISRFKGFLSEDGTSFLKYTATREDLSYELSIGRDINSFEKIEARYAYLKNIHLRYIQSTRDLMGFLRSEKKNLLLIAKKERTTEDIQGDSVKEISIQQHIATLNNEINELTYVANATKSINSELSQISFRNADYAVKLEAGTVELSTYIDQLSLNASAHEKNVGLGGDGRNNQMLMALWKAKGEREIDSTAEAVIYCIEEPEAHLHPHQQRKFAEYLVEKLAGQVIVTSHSPQIVEHFAPNSIVRLYVKEGTTIAASNGCSKIIDSAWNNFGYRMSIIPAEAFFADAVLLVEGPSEVLLYQALAKAQNVDFDYLNVSILQVGGVSFKVFSDILKAMHIQYVIRTDNDINKVPNVSDQWQLSGINRGRSLIGLPALSNLSTQITTLEACKIYSQELEELKESGIFISHWDLEHDLVEIIPNELCNHFNTDSADEAITEMQKSKAMNMFGFIAKNKDVLATPELWLSDIYAPIQTLSNMFSMRGGNDSN